MPQEHWLEEGLIDAARRLRRRPDAFVVPPRPQRLPRPAGLACQIRTAEAGPEDQVRRVVVRQAGVSQLLGQPDTPVVLHRAGGYHVCTRSGYGAVAPFDDDT